MGINCSSESSSWPEQLNFISDYKFVNFGRNGANLLCTQISAEILKNIPQFIILANWINEIDNISLISK